MLAAQAGLVWAAANGASLDRFIETGSLSMEPEAEPYSQAAVMAIVEGRKAV